MLKAAFFSQLPMSHPGSRTYFRALLLVHIHVTVQKKATLRVYGGVCYAKHQMDFYPDVLTAAEKARCRKLLLPSYTCHSYV